MNTQPNDFVMQAWRQQVGWIPARDAGARRRREPSCVKVQLEAAVDVHADLEKYAETLAPVL